MLNVQEASAKPLYTSPHSLLRDRAATASRQLASDRDAAAAVFQTVPKKLQEEK